MNPDQLQTGDVLHCTANRLISRLIRFFTKSKINHTALFIRIEGMPCILDSQKDGTNLRPFSVWEKKWKYKYVVHRKNGFSQNIENVKEFVKKSLSKSGNTPYDFKSLLIRQPWAIITKRWNNIEDEDKEMYCSEYVMWCWGAEKAYRMTPQDAFEWCLANGFEEYKGS